MKLLILGGNGMAGHILVEYFRKCTPYSVYSTSRSRPNPEGLFLDVENPVMVEKVLMEVAPDVIINCIGILNEDARQREIEAYRINGLLPHYLKVLADRLHAKLIHISTDCVFSGDRGNYTEEDIPDGLSVYARTKALGEIIDDRHLTIRTSIIGPEIRPHGIGLMQWFMEQEGMVKGYQNVYWNGVTTLELAKVIEHVIIHP
ncbi:MAG: family oxidoreductase, partial [Paenibacillus sp.]|nr:family oxidoreductase [Paenibacillus sp.]